MKQKVNSVLTQLRRQWKNFSTWIWARFQNRNPTCIKKIHVFVEDAEVPSRGWTRPGFD